MRRVLGFAILFVTGIAVGWVLHTSHEPAHHAEPPEMITVAYPDPSARDGRSVKRLTVAHTKTNAIGEGESVAAPKTDPAKTWVISLGKYGEPGWASFVAVVP